jgi:IS1 family transposase
VHALVGDGHHGKVELIQDLRCQACGKRVSERRGTALYGLKTASWRVSEVMSALAEGLDVGAAVRVFGHAEGTIQRWRTLAGMHAERMHERYFHRLELWHSQLDELKTRLREKGREAWVWVALDVKTKVIPSLAIGPRTQALCNGLIHGLCGVLAPGCVPVFTSDGLNMYFYALTAHFGSWEREEGQRKPGWVVSAQLLYGQVKKCYRRQRVVRMEYRMQWGALGKLKERLKGLGLSGRVNTAFVERVNLTLRQSIGFLIRRTWGTAQTVLALKEHTQWWRGYYHFVRPHEGLRVELTRPVERKGRQQAQRYRSRTPAMAAGLTKHRWTAREFLSYPLPAG